MKTKLLFVAVLVSTFINAQSIEFTSAELTTAEIGSTITINYKYTIASDGNIYCAINLYNDWTWAANVVDGSLSPAAAGTDMTGSFSFTIPEDTSPSTDLTDLFNYKLVIELSDNSWNWLAGSYPTTQINLTASTASVNDVDAFLNAVTIFPNPAKNSIQLKNLGALNITRIKIANILGKEVFTSNLVEENIDISNFNSGVYILSIQSENKSKNIKFIKN